MKKFGVTVSCEIEKYFILMEKISEISQREKRKDKKKLERKNSKNMHWFSLEGISTI